MATYRAMVMKSAGHLPSELEREVPSPAAGEVLVRVRASSMNYHDLVNLKGLLPGPWPREPMWDGAGKIAAVGEGVTDRVVG